ncbi:MAG TPA: hypothetical protein VGQ57_03460 [Polyangiaceae bacterium]|nr:hypothetical protein [Polyangiaceae bacterium]
MALRHEIASLAFASWVGVGCASPEQPAATQSDPTALGLACGASTDCLSGYCISESRAASGVSWTGGTCTQACTTASGCPAASTCVGLADGTAWCLAECNAATACRAGYVCSNAVGACLPDCRLGFSCGTTLGCDTATGACIPGTASVGAPCAVDADCQSGLCSPEQAAGSGSAWKGGYCTQACDSATCPAGSSCLTYADGTSYCAAACPTAASCRSGYVCSATVCLPDCRQGWSCGTTLTCNAATGACGGKELPLGDACTGNTDCASGLCTAAQATSTGTAWSGGYCTALCGPSTPCPAPAQCITYSDGSSCAAACATATDCRAGYVCSASVGACLPDCRQGFSCGALACNASTGACG